jgi:hypothetical protein
MKTGERESETEPQSRQGTQTEPSGLTMNRGVHDGQDGAKEGDGGPGDDTAEGATGADVGVRSQHEPVEALLEHFGDLQRDLGERGWIGMLCGRKRRGEGGGGGGGGGGVEGREDVGGHVELVFRVGGEEGLFCAGVEHAEGRIELGWTGVPILVHAGATTFERGGPLVVSFGVFSEPKDEIARRRKGDVWMCYDRLLVRLQVLGTLFDVQQPFFEIFETLRVT